MRYARSTLVLVFTAACLTCFSYSEAKKPGTPPGGGGDTPSFTPVRLDLPNSISTAEGPIPHDISDRNHAVGQVLDDQRIKHALYWIIGQNGATAYDLGGERIANALNEHDEIVGAERNAESGNWVPVLWIQPFASPVELPLPEGYTRGGATAVNDDGFIVGWTSDQFETTDENGGPVIYWVSRAAAWRYVWIDGTLTISAPQLLGGLENKDHWAEGVSAVVEVMEGVDAVKIVGSAYNSIDTQAVMWELESSVDDQGELQLDLVSGPTELGTLPGDNGSLGDTINRFGDVAGSPGFRKLYGQPLEELLPPSSINEPGLSYIEDINDLAEIVGAHYYGYGHSTAVLWLTDGSAFDLNKYTAGTEWARFNSPNAINNGQRIVGHGSVWISKRKKTTKDAAFVLIPN